MEALQLDENQLSDSQQYLTFKLAGEEYGIDILTVQEIRGFERATRIPKTPDYLLGVINLRGAVVPIVDLRVRFRLEDASVNKSTVIILVKIADAHHHRTIGMVVDAVSDVHLISPEELGGVPNLSGALAGDFITGIATKNEKMIILLDVDLLINSAVLEELEIPASSDVVA